MIHQWMDFTSGVVPWQIKGSLLMDVWDAQAKSAYTNTNNGSNVAVANSAFCSLSITNALASGILATGGQHAPIAEARRVIFHMKPEPPGGKIVPGFGNSFHKDQIDPIWQPLANRLSAEFAHHWSFVEAWSEELRKAGKAHFPNAAAITACVAEIVGWTDGAEAILAIAPRMAYWTKLYVGASKKREVFK